VKSIHLIFGPAVFALAACASTPPPELNDAHAEYNKVANSGPTAQLDPTDLHTAQESLAAADKSFDDNGDTPHTRDLAYAAQRKAQLADVKAQTIAAEKQQADAKAQLESMKDANGKQTKAQLNATQAQLANTGQALAISQQQKADAEKRAAEANAALQAFAKVKHDDRGMIITLSGGVLFASAKFDLLGQAQTKLSQVADVLGKQDRDSKIIVNGYTDSQGNDGFNQTLSQNRADSVRTYLVSHGIASDRITAVGHGKSDPVADNASPEGRADNRRVEIVVQPSNGSSNAGSMTPGN
jgi:outer membrane protein OmpA-like peptidoglycan-associated protein